MINECLYINMFLQCVNVKNMIHSVKRFHTEIGMLPPQIWKDILSLSRPMTCQVKYRRDFLCKRDINIFKMERAVNSLRERK